MAIYLVTGGAGFIGSNIVHELVRRGEEVRVLDNLSTGSLDNLREAAATIEFINADIRDNAAVLAAARGVDYVLHQAALRAVARSVDDPQLSNDVNITGTLNVLLAAKHAGVKRVVFASSSSVYGDVQVERNVESLTPQPASPYALSKLVGEHYCRIFSELYGLSTVSLRYFNVFGPHQNPESKYSAVIPIFVDSLLRGQAPEIHSDGEQSRDFTYIQNVVSANLLAAVAAHSTSGQVYNIGNGENISINQLYQHIQVLLGFGLEPIRTARRAGDVEKTFADISKAERELGYRPEIDFETGLALALTWYKERQSAAAVA